MATIREVAAAAGVSPSTVSLVMNGRLGFCSAETRERVLAIARELGYTPSATARALALNRTRSVAVVGEAPDDLHGAPMLAAVHVLARSFGYNVSLLPPHGSLTQQFSDRRFDVVLIARDVSQADTIGESIAGSHQIVVAAGSFSAAPPSRVRAAYWSDEQGMEQLAGHLAGLGHRAITFLAGRPSEKTRLLRLAAETLGLDFSALDEPQAADDFLAGTAMARVALSGPQRPTVLVGRTDAVALGALHAARELGLRVPEDLSIAGYYDFSFAPYLSPSLTTVYTPFVECATAVLTEALRALQGESVVPPEARATLFETSLRVRGSTGPACEGKP